MSYNGWSNYETYKIVSEVVDTEYYREMGFEDANELASYLESDIEEIVTGPMDTDHISYDLTVDFLGKVDWWEIADTIVNSK